MKIFFWALLTTLVGCQMVFGQNNSPKGFAIYLLPANLKPNQLAKLDLKKLKPTGEPLIAESDLWFYQKETHEFRIDYTAATRLKKINNQGGTPAFAVFVGDEAIYAGAFWKSILSQSFGGIVIDTLKSIGKPPYYSNTDFPVLTLEPGYPSAEYFKGEDLRSDSRILKALEKAGKLYGEVELLVKCKKITATGTRRPASEFTFEILSVIKGEFKQNEISFTLPDGKLLPELDAKLGWGAGENVKFNPKQEIILKISKQVGTDKPDWFIREYRKK
jgi:hypothetical protein